MPYHPIGFYHTGTTVIFSDLDKQAYPAARLEVLVCSLDSVTRREIIEHFKKRCSKEFLIMSDEMIRTHDFISGDAIFSIVVLDPRLVTPKNWGYAYDVKVCYQEFDPV